MRKHGLNRDEKKQSANLRKLRRTKKNLWV
jgi:hypothetical protein